ncbi:uncharacterized protein H6S33_002672 [Morchella sextelata]|uniref:uncharacterized protein n=1 Tax=Morchella sextelata TaxID=1174677 RepID=UPI001D048F65|nr:uncharacterized protein H6S33_002672 [Morchella sextelata]KAH0607638.1 hypothetical protein H6S33_002672 [Morchella sextelata]
MGESQLKRLKASLRTAGITGPQKSKKPSVRAKQQQAAAAGSSTKRLDRNVALQSIREEFNPFEIKTTREKHSISGRGQIKGAKGRPGLSKQIGEENRKRTLLVEMQRKHKAGGIVDRRFGENDPTMTPEEKMLERFTKEKQKRARGGGGGGIFNLDDGDEDQLTHFGKSLGADDFDDGNEMLASDDDMLERRLSKKRRLDPDAGPNDTGSGGGGGGDDDEEDSDGEKKPERKKSKAEVMKEVIAKSKLHKYERQKAKEDDEDEREKLDAQMSDIWALLGRQPVIRGDAPGTGANMEPIPGRDEPRPERKAGGDDDDGKINPGRLAQMEGKEDAEYDARVREMVYDKRSQPAERTKTAEEKALEESERLRKLEEARQRRMRGEEDSEDERTAAKEAAAADDDDFEFGDATEYGLGRGIPDAAAAEQAQENPDELLDGDYEVSEVSEASEDGYVDVDEDGNVDGSGAEFSDDYDSDAEVAAGSDEEEDDDGDDDFLADLMPRDSSSSSSSSGALTLALHRAAPSSSEPAYTYPCPQTPAELLAITAAIPPSDHPTIIQRIRILHHPKLHADNKAKLAVFAPVLLAHILHLSNLPTPTPPFPAIETLTRHLHALSKSHPVPVADAFRTHLQAAHDRADLTPADLVLLAAVATIYPTSDHFHQVVTPATIVLARWLSQTPPTTLQRLSTGAYLATLCLQYQKLSRRFVPEAIGFVLQGLSLLAPVPQVPVPGNFLYHDSSALRITKAHVGGARKMAFADIFGDEKEDTRCVLLCTLLSLTEGFAALWGGKKAFGEVFGPAAEVVAWMGGRECSGRLSREVKTKLKSTLATLTTALAHATHTRRPLELHHHRPLPIKTFIPKFEESYSADKRSYDPDKERLQLAKLKAEHKRERKGALRELRKDSSFVAREKLKEDKKKSKEYHAKMAKLTAMIQTEEGAAANEYKRTKKR